MNLKRVALFFSLVCVLHIGAASQDQVSIGLPSGGGNTHHVSNREPLIPSPLMKLKIGSITPKGWLGTQLRLLADGMVGNLSELSRACKKDSGWFTGKGEGWEEVPYWLKGFGDLGYVLKDKRITNNAHDWVKAVMKTQQEDGYFGPPENKKANDLWPNMVMLFAVQSYYEATEDKAVLSFMKKYFDYQSKIPRDKLFKGDKRGHWQKMRAGENLESIYWLYNRTGDASLLELAKVVFESTSNWTEGVASNHGVDICMGIRQPAVFYQYSKDSKHLSAVERNYKTVIDEFGQCSGGMFAADEICRKGAIDPCQAAETCSMVEFMNSFESLLKITGEPAYADRTETIAFNSLPAAMSPDMKSLHYLTAPNLVQCDRNENHNFQNQFLLLPFSPWWYRCCQHNVAQGWPYYAEHLWVATQGNGLAAALFAPCEVTAKVADGSTITILEETDYPFDERVNFTMNCKESVSFPLALRIPSWCSSPKISVNEHEVDTKGSTGKWVTIKRQWKAGDKVRLDLPMKLGVTVWEKIGNSVSVHRGPLSYSLKIGAKWTRYEGSDKWPTFEVFPTTPWNYGLIINHKDPSLSFKVVKKKRVADQPFTIENAHIEIHTKGKRIPNWKVFNNTVGKLHKSPIKSDQPEEDIILIPMGCARLRITSFPIIGNGPDANDWPELPLPRHQASHVHDDIFAPSDGLVPRASTDVQCPRFTWGDHRGTTEWITYEFDSQRTISSCEIYWYSDKAHRKVNLPESWKLFYHNEKSWKEVNGATEYGIKLNQFNKVKFDRRC